MHRRRAFRRCGSSQLDIPGVEMKFAATSDMTHAGQAVYSSINLKLYDLIVLGISNRFIWRCPTRDILALYDTHVTDDHLDVGVGTGWYLEPGGYARRLEDGAGATFRGRQDPGSGLRRLVHGTGSALINGQLTPADLVADLMQGAGCFLGMMTPVLRKSRPVASAGFLVGADELQPGTGVAAGRSRTPDDFMKQGPFRLRKEPWIL